MGTLHHTRRRKPTRLRGYRIWVWYQGQYASDPHRPVLWAAEPHLPAEWEATKNNPNVAKAVLFRSGKPFAQFTRPASASAHPKPGQNRS
jgi:hypothetical protein